MSLFHLELLGFGFTVGDSPGDGFASVAVLRPFELNLAMSCFSGLEQNVCRAWNVSSSTRAALESAGKPSYEQLLASFLRGAFARICGFVCDVSLGGMLWRAPEAFGPPKL